MAKLSKHHFCCPLCKALEPDFYHQNKNRQFFKCTECSLVFVSPENHLSKEEEKAEYDLHQNSPDDVGYRKFLKRLFVPINKLIPQNSHGLDFGCGPGPTLSVMLEEAGYIMAVYDYFYATDNESLTRSYDFITATEVIEHLRSPARDLDKLWEILKPRGYLGIMTKLVTGKEAFISWHYIQDPTHICFYSVNTLEWLADHWNAELKLIGNDVAMFRK